MQLADTQFGMTSAMKGFQYLNWVNWLTCELTRRKLPVPADLQPGMSAAAADELVKVRPELPCGAICALAAVVEVLALSASGILVRGRGCREHGQNRHQEAARHHDVAPLAFRGGAKDVELSKAKAG